MPNVADVVFERTQAIVARLRDVERSDTPLGCYFFVQRKIFAQVATVIDPGGQPVTMVAMGPDHAEVIDLKSDSYRLKGRDLGRVPDTYITDVPTTLRGAGATSQITTQSDR